MAKWVALSTDWHDHEMFDGSEPVHRLAWVCLLCYVRECGREQRAFDHAAFCERFSLPADKVRAVLLIAEFYGQIRWNGGRLVICDWREWGRGNHGRTIPHNWRNIRDFVLGRDRHTCRYCGKPANTVDHVVPYSHRGGEDPSNLVAACRECNTRKHARTPEQAGMELRGVTL